ncbi:M15 family metallopeptidase [Sanguibacter suaedae]|uniref:M15 family metallopeptidase n=1 Tax=Sanguibacter suaedae TaxID=2795737 RepID=UPI0027DDABDD|nr:M15 family metallopeptidase [Sanguibacter suaedae]
MSGIDAISSRILEIQTTISSVSRGLTPTQTSAAASSSSARTAAGTAATSEAFGSALAQAVAAAPAAPAPPAAAPASTAKLDANGIPEGFAAYGNGKIPREALTEITGTGHRLWAPAAQAFDKVLAAAKADGVTIGITDSYRTYESQVDLAQRKGLYSQGGLAAKPGTSDHGWGLSVDLNLDSKALAWMRANGASMGFVEDVPREPWHWTFQG